MRGTHSDYEVIVVDNASTDNSAKILKDMQKTFPELIPVCEPRRGYGSAYLKGIETSRGEYLFMADLDGTYDFRDLPKFIARLKEGYGLVVGNRFNASDEDAGAAIEKSAMPWHHQYIGNPVLSWLVRMCFGVRIHDIHCGMRAVTRTAIEIIAPHATGMEFASEMIAKAAKRGVRMAEIPIAYKKRLGESKLRSFADGWRHLRFILLYSPLYLFLLPGLGLIVIGAIIMAILYLSSPTVFGIQFFVHPMFLSAIFIIVGYELVIFSFFSKIYAVTRLDEKSPAFERLFKIVTLEKAALAGIILALLGGSVYIAIFVLWIRSGFGSLDQIKNSVVALTAVVIGVQTFFSAFMLSILGIREK